jgi:hypothetical protein
LRSHHYKSFDCRSGGEVMLGKGNLACTAATAKIMIRGGRLSN